MYLLFNLPYPSKKRGEKRRRKERMKEYKEREGRKKREKTANAKRKVKS